MKTKLKKILLGGGILSSVVGFSTPFFYSPYNSINNLQNVSFNNGLQNNSPLQKTTKDNSQVEINNKYNTPEEFKVMVDNYINFLDTTFNELKKQVSLKYYLSFEEIPTNEQSFIAEFPIYNELQTRFSEFFDGYDLQPTPIQDFISVSTNFNNGDWTGATDTFLINIPQLSVNGDLEKMDFWGQIYSRTDTKITPFMAYLNSRIVDWKNANNQLYIQINTPRSSTVKNNLEKLDNWKNLDITLEQSPYSYWNIFGKYSGGLSGSNIINTTQWNQDNLDLVYQTFKIPVEYQFSNQITLSNNNYPIKLTDWFKNITFAYQQVEPNKVMVSGVVNLKNVENNADTNYYSHEFYFFVKTTKTFSEYVDKEFNDYIDKLNFKEKDNAQKNNIAQTKTDNAPWFDGILTGVSDESSLVLGILDLFEQLPKVKEYIDKNNLYDIFNITSTVHSDEWTEFTIKAISEINKNYFSINIEDFLNSVDYDSDILKQDKDGNYFLQLDNTNLNTDDNKLTKGSFNFFLVDKNTGELFIVSHFVPFLNELSQSIDIYTTLTLLQNSKIKSYLKEKDLIEENSNSGLYSLKDNLPIQELIKIKEYIKTEIGLDTSLQGISTLYYSIYTKKINLNFYDKNIFQIKEDKKEELSTLNYTEITKDNLLNYFDLDYFKTTINEENYNYDKYYEQQPIELKQTYMRLKNSDFIPSNFTVKYDYANQQTIVEYDYLQSKKQFIIDKNFFANNLQETITENINKSIENLITNTLNNENKYNYTKLDLKNIKSEIEQQIIKNTSLNQVKDSITTQIKIIDNIDKSPQLIQTYATDWDEQNNIESIKKEFNLTLNISVLNGNDNNVSFLDFNIPFKFSKDNTKLINQKQTLNNTFNNLFNNLNTTQILETNKPKEYYLTNFENINTTINNNSFKDFFLEVFDINLDLFNKTNLYPEFTKTTNGYTLIVYDDFSNSKKIVATHTFNFDVSKLLTEKQQLENYISDIQKSFENTNDIYLSLSNVKKPDNISYLVDEKTDNSGYNITFKTQYTNIQSTIEFNPIKNDTNNTITKQNDNNIISNPFLWVGIGIGLLAIAIILYLVFKKKNKIEKIAKQKVKDGL